MRRLAPRGLGAALVDFTATLAPATTLARVQACWRDAVGETIGSEAQPVGERDGTVVVACSSSLWAQELELLGPELVERLNAALRAAPDEPQPVRALRCRVG